MSSSQALIDTPDSVRRTESFRRLALTDFKIEIPRTPKKTVLAKALQESGALVLLCFPASVQICYCNPSQHPAPHVRHHTDVFAKFEKTSWGQKLAKQKIKANMSDFDRFKAMVEKKKRSVAVKRALKK